MLSVFIHVCLDLIDACNNFKGFVLDFSVVLYLVSIFGPCFKLSWKFPSCFPLNLLLFFSQVLIVNIWSHSSLCKGLSSVTSTLFCFNNVQLDTSNLSISPFSEDILNSGNYSRNVNYLLHKGLYVDLELLMSWIMDNLPVSHIVLGI